MTSFGKLFLVWVFASTSLLAQSGSSFYVAKNGSDTNSGSYTAPWLTIQHAANSVTAGATVYVESGVYNESVNFPRFRNCVELHHVYELSRTGSSDRWHRARRQWNTGTDQHRQSELHHGEWI